jgi:hypothetical protein
MKHATRSTGLFLLFSLLVLGGACAEDTAGGSGSAGAATSGDDEDDDDDDDGDGDDDDDDGEDGGDDGQDGDGDDDGDGGRATCERYVACVAATSPATLEQVQEQYGDGGACWEDDDLADACVTGCRDALVEAHLASPDEPLCDACTVDAECVEAGLGRCVAGSCVACVDDADCTDPLAATCGDDNACALSDQLVCLLGILRVTSDGYIPTDDACIAAACTAEAAAAIAPGSICESACQTTGGCGHPCWWSDQALALQDCAMTSGC